MTAKYIEAAHQEFRHRSPLDRMGEPGDIADVAWLLITDAARCITGEIINVHGGIVMA